MDYDRPIFTGDFKIKLKPGTTTEQVSGMGYEVLGSEVRISSGSVFLTDFGVVVLTRDRQPFGWGYEDVVAVLSSEGDVIYN